MFKNFQTEIKILLIMAVITLVVGFVGFFVLLERDQGGNIPGPIITEVEVPEIQDVEVIQDNWQTYRNEEFGFEVKYPKGWEVVGRSHVVTIISDRGLDEMKRYFSIRILDVNANKVPFDEWMKEFAVGRNVRGVPQKASLGSYEIYKVEGEGGSSFQFFSDIYLIDKESRVLVLSSEYSSISDKKILEQILSTFRFVE